MATHDQQSNFVLAQITARNEVAEASLAATNTAIAAVRASLTNSIAALEALGFSVDLASVNTTVGRLPGVGAPALPSADDVAIGDTKWQAIFAQAAAEQTKVTVAEQAAAAGEAALRGLAVPSVVSSGWAAMAAQRGADRISTLAATNAIEQAKAAREDIVATAKLALEGYRYQHAINEAYERLQAEYEKLKSTNKIEPARLAAEYNLKKTELAMVNAAQELVSLAQINAQLTTAAYSSSDVGLSSTAEVGLSYPYRYNPANGDVVWLPPEA